MQFVSEEIELRAFADNRLRIAAKEGLEEEIEETD